MKNEKKRNHHYIFKRYLENWAKNGEIFYISKTGKISADSPTGLSRERDFYKLHELTTEDVRYLKLWIDHGAQRTKDINYALLDSLIKASIYTKTTKTFPALKDHGEQVQFNIIEDRHSLIERAALPILLNLTSGDINAIKPMESRANFYSFIAHQIMRTKLPKDISIALSEKRSKENGTPAFHQGHELFQRNWNILSLICSINISFSLLSDDTRDNYALLINNTSTSFITSDRPVNNFHPDELDKTAFAAPKKLDIFYPLSPTTAFLLLEDRKPQHEVIHITESDATYYNQLIAQSSFGTIYANSKENIEKFRKIALKSREHLKNLSPAKNQ